MSCLSTQIKWLMVAIKALTVRAKRVRGSWFLGYQRAVSICKQWQTQATKPEEDPSPKSRALRFLVLVCVLRMTITQEGAC